MGVTEGVDEGVGEGETGVLVLLGVTEAVLEGDIVEVGETVAVTEREGEGVLVEVTLREGLGCTKRATGVTDGVTELVGDSLGVTVAVTEGVTDEVGVTEGVLLAVASRKTSE